MLNYKDELAKAMQILSEDQRTLFIGQGAEYSGSPMYAAVKDLPADKRIELPVFEDTQMGMSIGLSLEGYTPISMFPRMDFLMCCMDQLVNHLDKIEEMSVGRFCPKVIIRTAVGAKKPLYPGAQHCQDYTDALKCLLKNIRVVILKEAEDVVPSYKEALLGTKKSTILIEYSELSR